MSLKSQKTPILIISCLLLISLALISCTKVTNEEKAIPSQPQAADKETPTKGSVIIGGVLIEHTISNHGKMINLTNISNLIVHITIKDTYYEHAVYLDTDLDPNKGFKNYQIYQSTIFVYAYDGKTFLGKVEY